MGFFIFNGGGGGSGAPDDSPYLIVSATDDGDLTAERRLAEGSLINFTDNGPNSTLDIAFNVDQDELVALNYDTNTNSGWRSNSADDSVSLDVEGTERHRVLSDGKTAIFLPGATAFDPIFGMQIRGAGATELFMDCEASGNTNLRLSTYTENASGSATVFYKSRGSRTGQTNCVVGDEILSLNPTGKSAAAQNHWGQMRVICSADGTARTDWNFRTDGTILTSTLQLRGNGDVSVDRGNLKVSPGRVGIGVDPNAGTHLHMRELHPFIQIDNGDNLGNGGRLNFDAYTNTGNPGFIHMRRQRGTNTTKLAAIDGDECGILQITANDFTGPAAVSSIRGVKNGTGGAGIDIEVYTGNSETDPAAVFKTDKRLEMYGATDHKAHTAFADSEAVTTTAAVQTTDATQTTIFSLTLNDDTVYTFDVMITMRDEAGVERASYIRQVRAHREAAGSATLGTINQPFADETTAGLDATFTVSGNDIRVSATGLAATTINWVAFVRYQGVSLAT